MLIQRIYARKKGILLYYGIQLFILIIYCILLIVYSTKKYNQTKNFKNFLIFRIEISVPIVQQDRYL